MVKDMRNRRKNPKRMENNVNPDREFILNLQMRFVHSKPAELG